ncbi:MAG: hypothetical protein CL609_08040 [Anaerolineaceae bacterium]|nr:hypothetical protein [Anaerolineaceae bacterium]
MKPIVQFEEPFLFEGLDWLVQRMSWSLPGGAEEALLEAVLPREKEVDWLAWLGSGLVITTPAGDELWSGTIEQIRIDQRHGSRVISMAELVNRVKVRYRRTGFSGTDGDAWLETDWLENTKSVARYGRRELLLELGQSSASQAEALGLSLLNQRAFPSDLPHLETGSQQPRVLLTCKGWWSGLVWLMDEEARGRICHMAGGKSHQILGTELSNSKLAQSFVITESSFHLGEVNFRLALVSAPLDDVVLEVCADENDQPGAVLASAVLPAGELNGGWQWVSWPINPPLVLEFGVRYWLVLRRSGAVDPLNFYKVESDDGPGYGLGVCKRWSGSGWVLVNEDLRFITLAVSPLPELIRDLVSVPAGHSVVKFVRINQPKEVLAFRWRALASNQAERLSGWLALASAPGRTVSAVVNGQKALDVFPLPRLPHLTLRLNASGFWQDPNGPDGRLESVPVGRKVDFQQKQWVVMAAEWKPLCGFVMTSLSEIP